MAVLCKYVLRVDLGFQGIKKDYPQHTVMIPHKSSKYHKNTQDEKEENYVISGIRVLIENII